MFILVNRGVKCLSRSDRCRFHKSLPCLYFYTINILRIPDNTEQLRFLDYYFILPLMKMNNTSRLVIIIIVVVLLIGGGYLFLSKAHMNSSQSAEKAQTSVEAKGMTS